jgi:membrane protein YdbS with pleckstrin-like domain
MTVIPPEEVVRPHRNLRALYLTYLLLIIWAGVLSWLLPMAFFLPPFQTLFISTGFFLLVLFVLWWTGAYFRTIVYRFTSAGISWERGVIIHRSGLMPYHLIAKVDIIQGPIQRFFGIYLLKVHADRSYPHYSSGTVLKINGITDPERLREFILSHRPKQIITPGDD